MSFPQQTMQRHSKYYWEQTKKVGPVHFSGDEIGLMALTTDWKPGVPPKKDILTPHQGVLYTTHLGWGRGLLFNYV